MSTIKSVQETASGGAVFRCFSNGVKTNCDAWLWNYDKAQLTAQVKRAIIEFNSRLDPRRGPYFVLPPETALMQPSRTFQDWLVVELEGDYDAQRDWVKVHFPADGKHWKQIQTAWCQYDSLVHIEDIYRSLDHAAIGEVTQARLL